MKEKNDGQIRSPSRKNDGQVGLPARENGDHGFGDKCRRNRIRVGASEVPNEEAAMQIAEA
jgi:hypothetical protein